MKFFVPSMDESQAEQVWAYARQYLSGLGLDTTRRRIRALAWNGGGKDQYVAVGDDVPFEDDGPVLVILESSDSDLFYVCTFTRGVAEDIPYPMCLNERWRVVDFDEEVVGFA